MVTGRKVLAVVGSMAALLGMFAIFGAVFMYVAEIFGLVLTWWQGAVIAFALKLAGQLMAPTIKVGGAR